MPPTSTLQPVGCHYFQLFCEKQKIKINQNQTKNKPKKKQLPPILLAKSEADQSHEIMRRRGMKNKEWEMTGWPVFGKAEGDGASIKTSRQILLCRLRLCSCRQLSCQQWDQIITEPSEWSPFEWRGVSLGFGGRGWRRRGEGLETSACSLRHILI